MRGKCSIARALAGAAVALLVLSCLAAEGCQKRDTLGPGDQTGAVSPGGENRTAGKALPAGKVVHACGRSVLGGWMEHLGWDWIPSTPVRFEGFDFYYHEMDQPPAITGSARKIVKEAGSGSVVFFKLCFADFEGGDENTARANLRRNQAIIDELVEYSADFPGQVLLLGNALPVVPEYCDRWLVWNQRAYNDHLRELAETRPHVIVVDLYGALSAPDGSLTLQYAVDRYDSHPSAAGYAAMDQAMRAALRELP